MLSFLLGRFLLLFMGLFMFCACMLLFMLVSVRPVPAWRYVLSEQFLLCTFCYVSVLFLTISVSADGYWA
jgi:hypothetical protein